jgi:hypothetical protein
VDTSREVVALVSSTPVGDQVGVVVIGPVDRDRVKSAEALDALLKTLEDLPPAIVQMVLWAEDIGAVPGTIRSRSDEFWCPPLAGVDPEAPFLPLAEALCEASLKRKVATVIETFGENKGMEVDLLRAAATVLARRNDWPLQARLLLWDSLRETLTISQPSARLVLAAFLV